MYRLCDSFVRVSRVRETAGSEDDRGQARAERRASAGVLNGATWSESGLVRQRVGGLNNVVVLLQRAEKTGRGR